MKNFLLLAVIVLASAVSAPRVFASTNYEYYGFNGTYIYQNTILGTPSAFSVEVGKFDTCCYSSYPPEIRFSTSTNSSFYDDVISGNDWSDNLFQTGGTIATTTVYFVYNENGYDVSRYVNGSLISSARFDNISLSNYVHIRNTYPPNDNGDYGDGTGTSYFINVLFNGTFTPPVNLPTHIVSLLPEDHATTTSPVDFELQYYIAPDDIGNSYNVAVSLRNIDQNTILGDLTQFFNPNDITFLDTVTATSSGYHTFASSSIPLADGNYRIHAELERVWFGFLFNPFSAVNTSMDHQFTVGTSTFIGNISQNSFSAIQSIWASTTATSTSALAGTCNPISGFSVTDCLAFLFIPDAGQVADTLSSFKGAVLTRFPVGYITDLYTIMSTSTVGTLSVIEATIPQGMVGAGSHLELDLTNVLDFVLYASSTTDFITATEDDTRTLYDITNDYWVKIVYLLTVFYVIARIFGQMFAFKGFRKIS